MSKKLCKSRKNKMIGGVCGGLAEYFNVDPTIVRIIAGVLCLVRGVGLLVYLIACIAMPYADYDFSDEDTDNLKSANIDPEDEGKSSEKSASNKKSDAEKGEGKLHSDEDFDNYFKK